MGFRLICLWIFGPRCQRFQDPQIFFIRNQDPRRRGTIAYEYVLEQVLGDQDAVHRMQPQSPALNLLWSLIFVKFCNIDSMCQCLYKKIKMKISCRKSNIAKLRFASIDPRWQILQEHRGFLSFTIALTEFCISFHSHLGLFVCLLI